MSTNPIIAVRDLPQVGRKLRRPSHVFALRFRPWQIQPCLIAPVLPGETMKNLLLQARVVTDPIKNPLIGWWTEFYFFYVKLRDLNDRDTITNTVLTNASMASLNSSANLATYHAGGAPDFAKLCLDRVTQEYFRDEDEAILAAAIDGLPLAQVGHPGWMDSAKDATLAGEAQHEFPGENPSLPAHMSAFTDHYAQWEAKGLVRPAAKRGPGPLTAPGGRAPSCAFPKASGPLEYQRTSDTGSGRGRP